MISPLGLSTRLRANDSDHGSRYIPLLALAVFIVCGLSYGVVTFGPVYTAAAVIGAICIVCVLANWRLGIWGVVFLVPWLGVLTVLTYPNTTMAVLAKDIAFIVPCYIGFSMYLLERRTTLNWKVVPSSLLIALTTIILLQIANPSLTSLYIGLIGAKVWLLYIPFIFIAPALIQTKRTLVLFLRCIAYVSIVPSLIGLLEVFLAHSGRISLVYTFYGKAANAMFFNGGQFDLGGGSFVSRIPSTLPAATQYTLYLSLTISCCLALLPLERVAARKHWLWLILAVDCTAALSNGQRGSYIYIPLLLLLAAVLSGRTSMVLRAIPILASALSSAVLLIGGGGLGLALLVGGLLKLYGGQIFFQDIVTALQHTVIGFGTGMDTQAALRYGGTSLNLTVGWLSENWYAKTVFELGAAGLVIVVSLWLTITTRAYRTLRSVRDPELRLAGAPLLAYILLMLFICFKGAIIDEDPCNVFIWIIAGILLSFKSLDTDEDPAPYGPSEAGGRSIGAAAP